MRWKPVSRPMEFVDRPHVVVVVVVVRDGPQQPGSCSGLNLFRSAPLPHARKPPGRRPPLLPPPEHFTVSAVDRLELNCSRPNVDYRFWFSFSLDRKRYLIYCFNNNNNNDQRQRWSFKIYILTLTHKRTHRTFQTSVRERPFSIKRPPVHRLASHSSCTPNRTYATDRLQRNGAEDFSFHDKRSRTKTKMMFNTKLVLLLVATSIAMVSCQVPAIGGCPEFDSQPDFDMNRVSAQILQI